MDKPPKNKLADVILSSRWTTIVCNALVMACGAFSGIQDFRSGNYELFGLMCVLVGFGLSGILYHSMVPGLMKSFGEIERAVVKAQVEKNVGEVLNEIKRQHPEISDIEFRRVQ